MVTWETSTTHIFRAFIITINSFGTELTKDDREKLYPTCGRLYPDGLKALARADDYDQVSVQSSSTLSKILVAKLLVNIVTPESILGTY